MYLYVKNDASEEWELEASAPQVMPNLPLKQKGRTAAEEHVQGMGPVADSRAEFPTVGIPSSPRKHLVLAEPEGSRVTWWN